MPAHIFTDRMDAGTGPYPSRGMYRPGQPIQPLPATKFVECGRHFRRVDFKLGNHCRWASYRLLQGSRTAKPATGPARQVSPLISGLLASGRWNLDPDLDALRSLMDMD